MIQARKYKNEADAPFLQLGKTLKLGVGDKMAVIPLLDVNIPLKKRWARKRSVVSAQENTVKPPSLPSKAFCYFRPLSFLGHHNRWM